MLFYGIIEYLESGVTALSGDNTLYLLPPTICIKTRSFFMSYFMDSYTQEDTCTFPVYQRLRELCPKVGDGLIRRRFEVA
jgi:hypothetical protein